MKVVPNQNCRMYREFEEENQICVQSVGVNCPTYGDSGSAVIQAISIRKNPTIIGILSGGPAQDATGDIPALYTKVSSYIEWIKEKTNLIFD